MIGSLTLEALIPIAGSGIGFMLRQFADTRREIFEIAKQRAVLTNAYQNAAAKRDDKGGTWMRRSIYFLIAGIFASVMVAGFMSVPVIVETEVTKGILFWKKVVTEFETINGVLFPVEIRQGFLALLGFYLGQGIK